MVDTTSRKYRTESLPRRHELVLAVSKLNAERISKDAAFVIDGCALEIALPQSFQLAIMSRTAICYLMTPSQKAQFVQNLKSCDFRTLALNDGGNDVWMIQQADISEFKFLKRLILVHGRHSYYRTTFRSITTHSISPYSYISSKSCVFATSLYSSVSMMAYNVLYISVPVLFSVPDKDLSDESVMEHPQILFYCQAGRQ